MEELILFQYADGTEQYVHVNRIDAFKQQYPDAVQLDEIPQPREKAVYTKKVFRGGGDPKDGMRGFGLYEDVKTEDNIDEKIYSTTMPDGSVQDLSLLDLADPKINTNLENAIIAEEEALDSPDLFKPSTRTRTISTGDYMDMKLGITPTEEYTYQPYEKELKANAEYLNELSEKGLLDKLQEEYRWDNTEQKEVPQNILEQFTRDQLKQGVKYNQISKIWEETLENMSDDQRQANLLARQQMFDDADAENYVDDTEKFMIRQQAFAGGEQFKSVFDFENNVLDDKYIFENPNNEETVEVNGKQVPLSAYKNYTNNFNFVRTEQIKLTKEYEDLFKRREAIESAGIELDLLGRDWSMLSKFGFLTMKGAGDLFVGGAEYIEAGANLILDRFDGTTKEERGTTLIEDYAQERRAKYAKLKEKFRPDQEFGDIVEGGIFSTIENFTEFFVEESGRQLPIFAAIAASGGTASALGAGTMASAVASGTTLGIMTGGQQIGDITYQDFLQNEAEIMKYGQNLEYNDRNWSDFEKFLIGTGYGAAEGALGTAPTFILMKRGKDLITAAGRKNLLDKTTKEFLTKDLPKEFGIGVSLEAPTEGLTQLVQNGLMISMGDKNIDLFDGVGHATFAGGMFGGLLGGGSVAMGMAMNKMLPVEERKELQKQFDLLDELKTQYKKALNENITGEFEYKIGDKVYKYNQKTTPEIRKSNLEFLRNKIKDVKGNIDTKLNDFNNKLQKRFGNGRIYEEFKALKRGQMQFRAEANRIYNDSKLTDDAKKTLIDDLAYRYQLYENAINTYLGKTDPNRFIALAENDKERYDNIIKKAEENLSKKPGKITDEAVQKEAYDIYLREEVDADVKKTREMLEKLELKTEYLTFNNEQEVRVAASIALSDPEIKEEEKAFWEKLLKADGNMNGLAMNVDGVYTMVTVKDTMVENERTNTATHESDHVIMWNALLKGQDFDWQKMADEIQLFLKETNPNIYNDMFGVSPSQRVETKDGKPIPMEVVINFMERINDIDLSSLAGKRFLNWFGGEVNNVTGGDINWKNNDDILLFISQLAKKIADGTFTKEDLQKLKKSELLNKYKIDKKDVEEVGKSESTLFEKTEELGADWSNLNEDQKVQRAQQIGLYWENFLNKKIKQQVSVDETEQFVLLNKFLGLDTDPAQIKQSFGYKRGFIDIVKRWDPAKNNSLAAWIQSANNLPMRILELAQSSKKFGRFESSIDEQREGSRPIEVIETSDNIDVQMDKTKVSSNEFRKLLKIEDNSDLYNKVISDVKNTLSKKEIKPLIKTNPKKLRQNLKKDFEKALAKEISNKIGTQKSPQFKEFITNKDNLQNLINLLGVKYRNRFPMFTNDGGRANVAQSKLMQQSDKGSFVSDTKAGNQIWIPKDVNKMSDQEIQDIADQFIQGRETKYKSLKNALANDLALDAVFTAMKSSPDIETQYEGLIGELSEAIKRDPEVAFSKSDYVAIGTLVRDIAKNGIETVFESPGVLTPKYASQPEFTKKVAETVQKVHDEGLLQYEAVTQFVQLMKKDPRLSEEARKAFNEGALTKRSDFSKRKDFADEMQVFAYELGRQIMQIMSNPSEYHLIGIQNYVLDGAATKKDKVTNQTIPGAKGDFKYLIDDIRKNTPKSENLPEDLDITKVRLMNKIVPKGLFKTIDAILNNKGEYKKLKKKGKIAELAKLKDEIIDANLHNKILAKHIIKSMIESNMSELSFLRLLQLQTSAAMGLRALTGLKYITVTDGPIGSIKGEHLADNMSTMLEIVDLYFEYKNNKELDLDPRIDDILEFHDQWIENSDVLDRVDKFGRNNPNKDLRIRLRDAIKKAPGTVLTFDMQKAETLIKARENKINRLNELKKSDRTRKILQLANSKSNTKRKGISVFDFDDTLARTKSKILVTLDGKTFKIDATEFALQSADLEAAGATFDFSEFNKVVDGKKGPLADLALKRQGKFGSGDIYVLTARPQEAAYAIHAFLKGIGLNIPFENITGLEDGRPEAKADWIIDKVAEGYNDFYFADDAIKNIKAVSDILKDVDVKSRVELAFSKSDNKFEDKINQIIENQSGIRKEIKYSEVVAKRRGADIGKYDLIMPASAEDFVGLLTYLTGKGEQGSKDREWLIENIAKPYFRGVDAINIAKTMIKTDYNKLLKTYKNIEKLLPTLIPDGDLTFDQAIRVYIWNKQGQTIPGLSKRDITEAVRTVKRNKNIKDFADGVERLGSVDGLYIKPEEGWDVGTILGDLNNLSNKVGRKSYLKDWLNTMEAAFTPAVMNKLEAIYGTRYVEALKDILYRMTNGTNRTVGQNRYVNAWLNWINNSVGTIMFFNRKSALLQSISTINFLNWSDNNPVKAAMAYANQPQFWKDFVYIWNSPKLKQRRRGLQTDLQWQEIASAAKRGKSNKVNAVISYLLKIGFTPTQLVDNFAIAAGGAPFYRNRVNTYLKKGMSQTEAETKAWEDFSNVAEETQQSGDPALISQEQASVLGRFILNFQNTPMQMVRLQKKAGIMIVRRQRYPGMSQMQSDFTNMGKIIYYGMIQNFIFTFLQNAMFALLPGFEGEEFDDIEKQGKVEEAKQARMINNMIDTLLRGSGIKGAVLSTIKNAILRYQKEEEKGFTADHTYTLLELANVSPSIGSKARKVYSSIQTRKFNKDVLEERGFSVMADGRLNLSPAYDVVGNLVSAAFNLPMDRVIAEVDALVEATDSRNANWQRIALALGWRTWDVNARNEEEDLIKAEGKEKRKIRGIEKAKETRAKNKQAEVDFYMNILPYMDQKFQNEFWMMSKADRNKYIKQYKK